MLSFPWKAGLKRPHTLHVFTNQADAERWCEQFGNKMEVWFEEPENDLLETRQTQTPGARP